MKPPPFLIGVALLFWGWQTDFLYVALLLAAILESPRWITARWEFNNDDFSRIWTFCAVLFFATALYAFTSRDGPADIVGLLRDPSYLARPHAGAASSRTAAALVRWLPMIFFPFIAAQAFSSMEAVPLETISLILRMRWKKARQLGQPLPPRRFVDVSYPYLIVCLFAAGMQVGEGSSFFTGLCAILAWALWPHRSRRFRAPVWIFVLCIAASLGYLGKGGMTHLQHYLENINPQWFSRRNTEPGFSQTSLGKIGRSKSSGSILIRVEPKEGARVPILLREASYRTYKNRTWYAGNLKNDFENIPSETNILSYALIRGKTNAAKVGIACYLNGGKDLLPLPPGCGRLENLAAYVLQKNSAGDVLDNGPGLVVFDAFYGPGATIDGQPDATGTSEDLFVPTREQDALDEAIAEMGVRNMTGQKAIQAIQGFFQSKFTYRRWQEKDSTSQTNETAISRFLRHTRAGHCEYFATATVLLLRELKIPARYAVGYSVHEGAGKKYVVRQRDAHAWCLVWDQALGVWKDFDTTPASWIQEEEKAASPLRWLSDSWSWMIFQIARVRWGQAQVRQYVLWGLAPVLALLFYQIIFRRRSRRSAGGSSAGSSAAARPGLDSEFYQVESRLAARGLIRDPGEPVSSWIDRTLAAHLPSEFRERLARLIRLHYQYRFDPNGLDANARSALRAEAGSCLAEFDQFDNRITRV
jgi:hypothetical protein